MRQLGLAVVAIVLGLLAVDGPDVSAQTISSGSIFDNVVDASGQVIPGADVVLVNEKTAAERRTVTNDVGSYVFAGAEPGVYTIRAALVGFKPYELKGNVPLANNRLAVPPLRLEVGAVAGTVTATAVGEMIATSQTAHQAVLDLRQVTNLSIRGRDPISLLKVLPGVSLLANDQETFGGSFATAVPSIQGSSTRSQTIYVDGINGGDGGGNGGGGGNFSGATNLDTIAEVNVQMSAYTAEYGLKGGAQVNFVTKHGGSQYKGTL